MQETKDKILSYFQAEFTRTRWPFFGLSEICYKFGKEALDACRELYLDGVVIKHPGARGIILEYVPDESKRISKRKPKNN